MHIQMNHNYRDSFRGILVSSILMNNPRLHMQFDNTEWYTKAKEGQLAAYLFAICLNMDYKNKHLANGINTKSAQT